LTPTFYLSLDTNVRPLCTPTLDLSLDAPFTIIARATLNASHPITFQKRYASLLSRPLYIPSLTFKNTRTGEYVARPTMHVHHTPANDNGLPTEQHKASWMMLYLNQPYVIEATFKLVITTGPVYPTPGMSAEDMKQLQSQQPQVRKWRHVRSLQDEQTYKFGISEEAAIKEWVAVELKELLKEVKNGEVPEPRKDIIRFEVVQGAVFIMKRPNKDRNLNDTIET
jgi:hypothetical protein